VQRLRRLAGRRSAREAERVFVAEGIKVVSEALAVGAPVEAVFVDGGAAEVGSGASGLADLLDRASAAGIRVHTLAPGVLERVASTVTPQPVLALVGYVDVALPALAGASLLVIGVGLRDPGNAGTVLRSAEAAGAGGVICCEGSVDLFNPKAVRASAGSLFRVPVVVGGEALEVLDQVGEWGMRRLGAVAHGGGDYASADLRAPVAFVVGNEAHGLPADVEAALDERVSIPLAGRSESLNVGMATAVLCFEAARQRRMEQK
jgi:RNA methyltransferase, TrmH family